MKPEFITRVQLSPPVVKSAVIKSVTAIKPVSVSWLWPGRIAIGKITMISGDPGLGKSMIGVELAKHVSRGTPWPVDNTVCHKGSVLLVSGEDDTGDTIRPRLDAIHADVNKIFFLECIHDIDDETGENVDRDLLLKRDIELIENALRDIPDCRLIIIDPISAYLGNADSHNNSEIRGLLKPLADMANRKQVAIVVISHFNKGSQTSAMYRTTGSLAFVAAARAAYAVAKDQDNPDRRLFLPIKNNLGPDRSGLAYTIRSTADNIPYIEWEPDPVSISADDALTRVPDDVKSELDEATEWLKDKLKNGPVSADDVFKEASKCHISERTLKRAKRDLKINSKKRDFAGGWSWALPEDGQPQGGQPCHSPLAPFDRTQAGQAFQPFENTKNAEGGQASEAGNLGTDVVEVTV